MKKMDLNQKALIGGVAIAGAHYAAHTYLHWSVLVVTVATVVAYYVVRETIDKNGK